MPPLGCTSRPGSRCGRGGAALAPPCRPCPPSERPVGRSAGVAKRKGREASSPALAAPPPPPLTGAAPMAAPKPCMAGAAAAVAPPSAKAVAGGAKVQRKSGEARRDPKLAGSRAVGEASTRPAPSPAVQQVVGGGGDEGLVPSRMQTLFTHLWRLPPLQSTQPHTPSPEAAHQAGRCPAAAAQATAASAGLGTAGRHCRRCRPAAPRQAELPWASVPPPAVAGWAGRAGRERARLGTAGAPRQAAGA